jgi:formylglycine-generating enzyme required for sulfatase activity
VLDRAAARAGQNIQASAELTLDDGFAEPAPVDAQKPNPFGFHGILGNVHEWCGDAYRWDAYRDVAPKEPFVEAGPEGKRVARGGSSDMVPTMARASARIPQYPDRAFPSIGVRPARKLRR